MKIIWDKHRSFFGELILLLIVFSEINGQTAKLQHSTVITLPVDEETQDFKIGLDLLIDDNFHALDNYKFMVIADRNSFAQGNQYIFDIVNIRLGTRCRSCVQVLDDRSLLTGSGFRLSQSQLYGITKYYILNSERDRLSASMLNGA